MGERKEALEQAKKQAVSGRTSLVPPIEGRTRISFPLTMALSLGERVGVRGRCMFDVPTSAYFSVVVEWLVKASRFWYAIGHV